MHWVKWDMLDWEMGVAGLSQPGKELWDEGVLLHGAVSVLPQNPGRKVGGSRE